MKFRQGEVLGDVFYRNPDAQPVEPIIRDNGERKPFSIENAEWISKREKIGEGGYGIAYWGKIKVKGKTKSERCVVKEYKGPGRNIHLKTIINRVGESGVTAPKMSYLESGGRQYVIMEAFIQDGFSKLTAEQPRLATKFTNLDEKTRLSDRGFDLARELDLSLDGDAQVFRTICQMTGKLAKAGIYIRPQYDGMGPRIDAFSSFLLKGGAEKVIVQDLDTLKPRRDTRKNWSDSITALTESVTYRNPGNRTPARHIIMEVARQMGFSRSSQ